MLSILWFQMSRQELMIYLYEKKEHIISLVCMFALITLIMKLSLINGRIIYVSNCLEINLLWFIISKCLVFIPILWSFILRIIYNFIMWVIGESRFWSLAVAPAGFQPMALPRPSVTGFFEIHLYLEVVPVFLNAF